MKDTYTEIYFHFVWATKGREAMITPIVQATLYPYVQTACRDRGVHIYALGGITDHVHLVCALPTNLAVADLMQQIKGGSAHLVNNRTEGGATLRWQPGYGALTLTARDLKRVIAYVDGQEAHHRDGTLLGRLERCAEAVSPLPSPGGASRTE